MTLTMTLTQEKIASIENCYFAPSFNLTKEYLVKALSELKQTQLELVAKLITPKKVVGGGYKNGRKVAMNWLAEQIATKKYLLENFDTKNQTR